MTRHELKEQLQHDHFTDAVSEVVSYAVSKRDQLIRWSIALLVVLVLAGAAFWYASYRSSIRQQDLQGAFTVADMPVGAASPSAKTFPTEAAKRSAVIKAFAAVAAKDAGSREGLIAQYYLGTAKAQNGDAKGAEADLKVVAASNNPVTPLAKIALAQLYSSQNRLSEARALLNSIVNKPSDLVSKAQAQVLLANLDATTNPQETKKILQSLKTPNQDPAVTRAADQISSQLPK